MKLSCFWFISVHCYLQIELSVYVMVVLAVIVISYHCWDWHFQSNIVNISVYHFFRFLWWILSTMVCSYPVT